MNRTRRTVRFTARLACFSFLLAEGLLLAIFGRSRGTGTWSAAIVMGASAAVGADCLESTVAASSVALVCGVALDVAAGSGVIVGAVSATLTSESLVLAARVSVVFVSVVVAAAVAGSDSVSALDATSGRAVSGTVVLEVALVGSADVSVLPSAIVGPAASGSTTVCSADDAGGPSADEGCSVSMAWVFVELFDGAPGGATLSALLGAELTSADWVGADGAAAAGALVSTVAGAEEAVGNVDGGELSELGAIGVAARVVSEGADSAAAGCVSAKG